MTKRRYPRSSHQGRLFKAVFSLGALLVSLLGSLFFYLDGKVSTPSKRSDVVTVTGNKSFYNNVLVTKVIDGDTFEIEGGQRVRLIGVDTPESKKNKKAISDSERSKKDIDTIIAMGKKAKGVLEEILITKRVRLQFDVGQHDKYGRLLAYVYVDASYFKQEFLPACVLVKGKEVFVNATLLKLGYASLMTIPPNVKFASVFEEFYQQARLSKRGLWMEEKVAKR